MNDDEIDRLLHVGDPAASLPDLTQNRIDDLTEHAMSRTTPTLVPDAGQQHPRHVRRRVLTAAAGLFGAAAVAAIAVPLALGGTGGTTALKAPAAAGPETICAPVSADLVGQAKLAFRAEVTSVTNGTATLHVLQRYTGDVEDTVTVAQGTDAGVVEGAPMFTAGDDYLVTSDGTTVGSCGSTGVDTPALRAIYDRAFAR